MNRLNLVEKPIFDSQH